MRLSVLAPFHFLWVSAQPRHTFACIDTCLYHAGDEYAPRMEKEVTFTEFGFWEVEQFCYMSTDTAGGR